MAASVQKVTLAMKLEGFSSLKGIDQDFKKFQKTLKLTAPQVDKLVKGITKVHHRTKLSKTAFEGQISALTKLRNNVGIGTVAYTKLSTELDKVRTKMNAVTAAAAPQGGMFARLNKRFQKIPVGGRAALGALAGTATAGLGSTGQLAFAGGAVGGAPGAMIGAGLGAAMDTAKFAAESATYASEIQKLEIALKGVTKDQATFEKGMSVIAETSKRLNVPIAASTKQFTTLSASVIGSGGSIEDAETVFVGVSEAIKATGGNAEDVQSAIRAMSQIFGKGKVSAEELQGQLGERLAGAVVKFAEANGSSLSKLQKDLRDGTVGLDQVIKFAKKLNVDFGKTAEKVANSSADAGQRLKVQMDNLKLAIGKGVLPLGAAFQKSFAEMTEGIVNSEIAIKGITHTIKFFGTFALITVEAVRFLTRTTVDYYKIIFKLLKFDFKGAFEIAQKGLQDTAEQAVKNYKRIVNDIYGIGNKINKIDPKQFDNRRGDGGGEGGLQLLEDTDKSPLKSFADSAFKFAEQAEQAVVNAFKGMEDALVKFVMTGKLNFADFANAVIADLTRMMVRALIVKPLFNFLFPGLADGGVVSGGEIVKSAKGNVFAKNKIVPYAMGGIVNKPTLFPMANGMGLMGEAGAEAVMPLRRHSNGKLGVEAAGGMGNVVVNVDAKGTATQGNNSRSKEFGRLIGVAIEAEIVKQKRPGGLLYN